MPELESIKTLRSDNNRFAWKQQNKFSGVRPWKRGAAELKTQRATSVAF
jgi:hypothetical protein